VVVRELSEDRWLQALRKILAEKIPPERVIEMVKQPPACAAAAARASRPA
jgi:hypothetical protein